MPDSPEYEVTPEDIARRGRVHNLISARPEAFAEAGTWLDRIYSADAIGLRAARQREAQEKLASAPAPKTTSPLDVSKLLRTFRIDEIPKRFLRYASDDWESPLRRWRVLLHNVETAWLPVTVQSPTWGEVSKYPLIYWITCEPRAESGPTLSGFQAWAWTVDDEVFGRSGARFLVRDWPKLNRAVDLAFAVARSEGIMPPDEGDLIYATLDQAAAIAGSSKRTLERHVKGGKLPKPDIQGGRGKASFWRWDRLLPPLEALTGRKLPTVPPWARIQPPN